jgi:hypothetical protein
VQTRIISLSLISFAACIGAFFTPHQSTSLAQQPASPAPFQIRGHTIGEPVRRFLRLEIEARDEVEVCRQNPNRPACGRLLDAIEYNKRAEISTTAPADLDHPEGDRETTNFVLDEGKLVKISMLVNEVPEELKSLGRPSSEKSIPSHDTSGAEWENQLTVWDTPNLYVFLNLDNNPSLTDHHLSLTIEAPNLRSRLHRPRRRPPQRHRIKLSPTLRLLSYLNFAIILASECERRIQD